MPRRGTDFSAGLDLFATQDGVVPCDGLIPKINTGVQMALPPTSQVADLVQTWFGFQSQSLLY